jgi:hypothetical protein
MGQIAEYIDDPASKKAADVVKFAKGCLLQADNSRQRFEPEWWRSAAFLAGNQYTEFVQDVLRYTRVPFSAPHSKAKVISNQILPMLRSAVAAIDENMPDTEGVAASQEPINIHSAEVVTDFLQWRFGEDKESDLRPRELIWLMVTGEIMRHVWWDTRVKSSSPGGMVEGDIQTDFYNPFQYFKDPWADCGKPGRWLILADVRDVSEIKNLYGVAVEPEEVADKRRYLDKLLFNAVEDKENTPDQRNSAAILYQMYVKPTDKYPEGRIIRWAGDKLLSDTPLQDGIWPFVQMGWFYSPGRQYPLSFVGPLCNDQKEYNDLLSQLKEVVNRQLRGDIAVAGPGEVNVEHLGNGAKVLRTPPNMEWQMLTYNLPVSEAETRLARIITDMQRRSGTSDPMLGDTRDGAQTATEITILKESDSAGLGIFQRDLGRRYCDIDRLKLAFASKHYIVPRQGTVTSENDVSNTAQFWGADMSHTKDVRLVSKPRLTPYQKSQLTIQAMDKGWFGPFGGNVEAMLAARTGLKALGLTDSLEQMEDQVPTEELLAAVTEIQKASIQAAVAQAQMQAGQMLGLAQAASQGVLPPGSPGAPPQMPMQPQATIT